MNNHSESGSKPENPASQLWGLKHAITPFLVPVWYRRATDCIFSLTVQDLSGHLPSMLQCASTRHFR